MDMFKAVQVRRCYWCLMLTREDDNIHKEMACKYPLYNISARLSENGTMVTFDLDTCFLRHTSTS